MELSRLSCQLLIIVSIKDDDRVTGLDRVRKILQIDRIHAQGITGKGIGVAVLDTGVFPHTDIAGRIAAFYDFVQAKRTMYDDNGHGTHVSGIIAGNGIQSKGVYKGVAPDAQLIMLKCLDESGNGSIEDAKKCIDFIIRHQKKYNIRIVNISIGSVLKPDSRDNEVLIESVEKLWKHGFVVIVAAGNNGPAMGSITVPGCAKSVITVGASDDGMGLRYRKNRTSLHYSGRGPTESCVVKPEILCPGTEIMSCAVGYSAYAKKSGTSMAAPVVAGVVALLLERYPHYTNKQVKKRLYETAIDLGYDKNYQGWGLLNPAAMVLEEDGNE